MELANKKWHSTSIEETLKSFAVSSNGLDDENVTKRRNEFGTNDLQQQKKRSIFAVIFDQFKDIMIIILIIAAILGVVFGIVKNVSQHDPYWYTELAEGLMIFLIVLINATIGAIQEIKASNALEALKKIGAPTARVIRNGKSVVIPASEIVIGDIVYIEDGAIVPADLRLIESSNLKIQESSLTGESESVEKDASIVCEEEVAMADRKNICYSSSIVTYGNGVGVAIAIGMKTEVGKIAKLLNEQDEQETPIKKKLNKVGKVLSIIGAITAVIVLVIGWTVTSLTNSESWKNYEWLEPLMLAITLAVAVIPEGLPATATIVMSLGVQRMAKKNAIIRKLPVVETLGNATIVCSDKTGTLTLNQMTVTHLLNGNDIVNKKVQPVDQIANQLDKYKDLIITGILCNNAQLDEKNPDITLGDPTEGALLKLGSMFNISYKDVRQEHPRIYEQPFDSKRKRMSSLHQIGGKQFLFTKGAAEELLQKCKYIEINNEKRLITSNDINDINDLIQQMSSQALRVLGYAKTEVANKKEDLEYDLCFIGLTGMIDPPRKEVIQAIKTCHEAGIRTIMITGDHKITAKVIATELGMFYEKKVTSNNEIDTLGEAIKTYNTTAVQASKLGILNEDNIVITGEELDKMDDATLSKSILRATVFARVSPEAKLRIVKALQANKEIVAMTGDGVNDAPALKSADIGISMGITGTDVAKDASDMILLDDNFTTIEGAIHEGRRIFRNIQKVVQYLIAGNVAEILIVLVIFLSSAIATACSTHSPFVDHNGNPIPLFPEALNPIQLLLINVITETIPCIGLGLDPAEKNIMTKQFQSGHQLLDKRLIIRTIWHGTYLFSISIIAYCIGSFVLANGSDQKEYLGMTMAFMTIAISQSFHALNMCSDKISIFSKEHIHGKLLYGLVAISLLITLMFSLISMYSSNAYRVLGIYSLNWRGWITMLILAISIIPVVETAKILRIN